MLFRSTNRVAIILTSLSRVFFTSVLEGIHREASQLGYSLLITETHDNIQEEIQAVDFFASQWVDGIILASSAYGTDKATRDHIARLSTLSKKDTRIPVVTLEFPLNNPQVGALKACEEAGVSVPEQIAIVGIDDIFAASIVSPSLTSIHVPKHKMGASAMQLLHTAIEQNGIGRRKIIKLDFELIERETTRKGAENSLRFLEW